MIFVTLGSQKFQFNRLLREIDRLIEDGKITEKVFAQIGYSDYKPKNYEHIKFLDRDSFEENLKKCDSVITHGGTGAIISAIKKGKKVIALPRLKKFEEHVDDHQIQIVNQFMDMNLIIGITEVDELEKSLAKLEYNKMVYQYISNTENIINSIEEYISK